MSECECYHYCKVCKGETLHIFSGSGTKGQCMRCDTKLGEDERADIMKCVSYNG